MRSALQFFILGVLVVFANCYHIKANRSFTIDYDNDTFLKDGEPFRYVSAEMHYFRTPHQYWRDRLRAVRAAGLNAVSTYVEWSFHEPEKGQYLWEGDRDLIAFIKLAVEEDLLVLLRPGPYICAERDNGGLPYWLFTLYPNIVPRTSDENYKKEVAIWYDVVLTKVQPYLYGNGGPIIMVQVENEYGSGRFPTDLEYVKWLKNLTEKYVSDKAVLYSADRNNALLMVGAMVPGVYPTINFGTDDSVQWSWSQQRVFAPKGPLVNSEFYPGWFTLWGGKRKGVETEKVIKSLGEMLETKANVNFYMFHGGTNFAFSSGALLVANYDSHLTSYDYDAPLTEAGDITEKYLQIRKKVGEYLELPNLPIPTNKPKAELLNVKLTPKVNLLQDEGRKLLSTNEKQVKYPINMEAMKQDYGYILYETNIPESNETTGSLKVKQLRDRAYVYLDSELFGIMSRKKKNTTMSIPTTGKRLQILVENQGRINWFIADDMKGIVGNVTLDKTILENWNITSFPVSNITGVNDLKISKVPTTKEGPVFYTASFVFNETQQLDSFLDVRGWNKGVAWVNGRNLGRYWPAAGPQRTLYVPGVYLNQAPTPNILTLMEVEGAPKTPVVNFLKEPILD